MTHPKLTPTEHFVVARDGVLLATDVYLPAKVPAPVVLVREPYDKRSRYTYLPQLASRVTERGYALVAQDVRGRHRSGGETFPVVHETDDAWDTLEWINSASWSAGRVGMMGDSYYGLTQWAAVASGHQALRAIAPRVTSPDFVDKITASPAAGGEPAWLEGLAWLAQYWNGPDDAPFQIDWSRRPLSKEFDRAFETVGRRSAAFDAAIDRGATGSSWRRHPFDSPPVPVLQIVGWYDNMARWAMRDYQHLMADPKWRAKVFLLADATDHENFHLDDVPVVASNDHDVDDDALHRMFERYVAHVLDFFDAFVRKPSSADAPPRVRWSLAHVGLRDATSWPPPGSRPVRLPLLEHPESWGLGAEAEVLGNSVTWIHDPANPVPSMAPDSFATVKYNVEERFAGSRDDLLTFATSPGPLPVDLAGPVVLTLELSTEVPQWDLFARLLDRAEDGSEHLIARGAAHGDTLDAVVTVDLGHTGYRVGEGHSLVLRISASDYPFYTVQPASEEDPLTASAGRAVRFRVQIGVESQTRLNLTIVDRNK